VKSTSHFNILKTSLNGTLPALAAAFKWQEVLSISQEWYGWIEQPSKSQETVLVNSVLKDS
jgi:hypothetical protein